MVWYFDIGLYLWGLFKLWITALFVAPFKNLDMLWLLIPIWATWFFAEFFQEKRGTSMGNAITNAVIVLWGSIDCSRQTVHQITQGAITGLWNMISRFALVAVLFGYGIVIVTLGLKGNKLIKYIGRIREVTYAFAIFAPIFYNAMDLTLNHFIAALLFFPLFYFVIELIDRYTPNPKAVQEDIEEEKEDVEKAGGGFGTGSGDGLGSALGEDNAEDLFGSKKGKKSGGLDDFKL